MSSMTSVEQNIPFNDIASVKFNYIRFPEYRIACKLREFQKTSNFLLIDQFNTLESFREFSLNGMIDLNSKVGINQVYSLISYLFEQLSQRLPSEQRKALSVDVSCKAVFDFIHDILDPSTSGFVNIFELKIILTLLCQSSYANKLQYIFTLITDTCGLRKDSTERFLSTILMIVKYFEGELINIVVEGFTINDPNDFVQKLSQDLPESQKELLSWLIIYHRLPEVENVKHDEACSACKCSNFTGFRYKCKECTNYILCQECFWSGKSSGNHSPDKHSCKEYSVDKKMLRGSLRRSIRNSFRLKNKRPSIAKPIPERSTLTDYSFNMSNIITSPLSKRKQMKSNFGYKFQDYHKSPLKIAVQSDEHSTIKHYLSIINDKVNKPPPFDMKNNIENDYEKTIQELENRNRELMKQINNIKSYKQNRNNLTPKSEDLNLLRQKQNDLEVHLNCLQQRREMLMKQLDDVMKTLTLDSAKSSAENTTFSDVSPMSNSVHTDCSLPDNSFHVRL